MRVAALTAACQLFSTSESSTEEADISKNIKSVTGSCLVILAVIRLTPSVADFVLHKRKHDEYHCTYNQPHRW